MTHKRITERIIQAGEEAIEAEAIAQNRHGTLAGVEVDFRHPDLSDEWLPRPQWFVFGPPPANAGILFPNEAAELIQDADAPSLPVIEARAGDRVSVERVLPQIVDGRLDHPHDKLRQLVYLQIERPSGEVVHLPEPLAFFGRTQVREGPGREAFDNILSRICAHNGVTDIHNGADPCGPPWGWSSPLERVALGVGATAHDAYFRLLAKMEAEGVSAAGLRSLVNAAALAGFLLGKVEARKAEKVALASEKNRQLGTAKIVRSDWPEKAKAIWAAHPDYRRTRVANLIAEGTDDDPRSISRAIKTIDPHRH